jgi:hypothetical protein
VQRLKGADKMSGVRQKGEPWDRTSAPNRHSAQVRLAIGGGGKLPDRIPISVDIFKADGKWYCQVCRGGEATQSLGPYSKEQAERIQDIRRSLLAKNGTGLLAFKAAENSADRKEGAFPQPTENAVS